jgi:hypothetical protein
MPFFIILNLTRKPQTLGLGCECSSLLLEKTVGPELILDPYGVEIIEMAEY